MPTRRSDSPAARVDECVGVPIQKVIGVNRTMLMRTDNGGGHDAQSVWADIKVRSRSRGCHVNPLKMSS